MLLVWLAVYLGAGVIFAALFATFGVGRLDPAASGASRGFKLLTLPGVTALWPYLAWRWLRGLGPPEERGPHRPRGTRQPENHG